MWDTGEERDKGWVSSTEKLSQVACPLRWPLSCFTSPSGTNATPVWWGKEGVVGGSVVPQPNHITKGTQAQFQKQANLVKNKTQSSFAIWAGEKWRVKESGFQAELHRQPKPVPPGPATAFLVLCPPGQGHPHRAAGTGSACFYTELFQHTETAEM